MKTGRVDCICGNQIISNSGKTMGRADEWGKIACWGCGKLYNYDSVEAFRVDGEAVTYQMKIFKMNDCDWWMDTDLESAKKNYIVFVEAEPESVEDAREMTEEELDNHVFHPDDDIGEPCSFRERFEEQDLVPQFFASTEL